MKEVPLPNAVRRKMTATANGNGNGYIGGREGMGRGAACACVLLGCLLGSLIVINYRVAWHASNTGMQGREVRTPKILQKKGGCMKLQIGCVCASAADLRCGRSEVLYLVHLQFRFRGVMMMRNCAVGGWVYRYVYA